MSEGISNPYKQNQKKKKSTAFSLKGKNVTISNNSEDVSILGFENASSNNDGFLEFFKGGTKYE
jgi:hypothetical protein